MYEIVQRETCLLLRLYSTRRITKLHQRFLIRATCVRSRRNLMKLKKRSKLNGPREMVATVCQYFDARSIRRTLGVQFETPENEIDVQRKVVCFCKVVTRDKSSGISTGI